MRHIPLSLQELKDYLHETNTFKQAEKLYSFKNKCCDFTNQLYDELKDKVQSVRVSVEYGGHWFLLCNTSDKGIVIVDPTYQQNFSGASRYQPGESDDHPFFIGTRGELYDLSLENEHSEEWFNIKWPVAAKVIYRDDVKNDEIKKLFDTDGYSIKTGKDIQEKNIKEVKSVDSPIIFFKTYAVKNESKKLPSEKKNNPDLPGFSENKK